MLQRGKYTIDSIITMNSGLKLLLLVVCVTHVTSFFDFLKSTPKTERVEQHIDTNPVRGAPVNLHSRYLQDPFVCDGKAQKQSIVNDGFCDCADKTDEPGTSACQGTYFHCINKGYKMIKIPSSRVDDQVCDCCDGSDEGRVANCSNTCNEAAEKERAQLTKVLNNFKAGSAVRDDLIKTVKTDYNQLAAAVTPIGMEIHKLQEELDATKNQLEETRQSVQSLEASVATEQRRLLLPQLQLEQFDLTNLAHLLSNLLKVLKVSGGSMVDAIKPIGTTTTTAPESATPNTETDTIADEEDEVLDDHYENEHEHEVVDIDAATDDVIADASTGVEGESRCTLVALTDDIALQPLCDVVHNIETATDALVNVILKRHAYEEIALLLGFYRARQTLIGSDLFVRTHLDTAPGTCPAEFENTSDTTSSMSQCSLKNTLEEMVGSLEVKFGLTDLRTVIDTLTAQSRELNVKKSDADSRLSKARTANDELSKYANHLEYLALKDQCFEKEDGAFIYSLCMLGRITQKEVVGHREVTLGTFQSFEEGYENAPVIDGIVASTVMKFSNGQHCHAFGARTASVVVTCAAKHALISATEPSTCAYKLHFESPVACTPRYAEVSGVASMSTI